MNKNGFMGVIGIGFVLLMSAGTTFARPLVVCDDVQDPATLDPQKEFTEKNHAICQQIFDGLVRFDSEGRIEPALAVSWQRIDPLRIQFKLRENVSFHNGEPFNSQSVKFSIERYLNPATGFPAISFIQSIAEVEIVDDHTINLVTIFPDGLLLNRLAGFILVVPPRYIQEVGEQMFARQPVGTGPFQFKEWEPGKHILLSRNQDYWMKGLPRIDELVFRFIPVAEQLKEFFSGKVDVLTDLPGTVTFKASSNDKTQVIKKRSFYTVCATMNTTKGALKDLRVRQALNYAINKEELIRYDLLGNGQTIASLSMEGEIGHDPDIPVYAYDPKKARDLLKESGVSLPLKLKTLTRVQGDRTARIIARQLKEVGIELDIYAVTTDANVIHDMASKDFDLGIAALPDVMGHIFFLQSIMIYSKSPFSIHRDPDYDRLLESMVVELDPVKHEEAAKSLDRYVHDQALSLFTYQRIRTYGVSKKIQFIPHMTGNLNFCNVTIPEQ